MTAIDGENIISDPAGTYGQVAQLVEHGTENPGVGGSNPPLPTFQGEMTAARNKTSLGPGSLRVLLAASLTGPFLSYSPAPRLSIGLERKRVPSNGLCTHSPFAKQRKRSLK